MAYLVRPVYVFYVDAKGRRVPKGTAGAKKKKQRSRYYYPAGVPGWPKGKREPLASDKTAANKMLADRVREAEQGIAYGVRSHAYRSMPIAEQANGDESHLAAWRRSLEGKGDTAEYVGLAVGRVRDLVAGCGFVIMSDISADRVSRWLDDLRRDKPTAPLPADVATISPGEIAGRLGVTVSAVWQQARRLGIRAEGRGRARRYCRADAGQILARAGRGTSVQTANYYLGAFKSFCRWLVRDGRIGRNPVEHIAGGNPKMDRRHDRRELAVEELLRVLDAARSSTAVFRGLAGVDRLHLYLAACGTGFRADELAALTPESFALESDPPTASLPASATKNRKAVTQPLSADVAAALGPYLAGRPPATPVWPGNWADDAAEMLRIDLAAAGVPYEVPGPDGPLFADFHALRHTYASQVTRSGATVKQAQALVRHSKAELTIGRYSHAALPELGRAVDRLPALAGPPAIVTGGEGSTVEVVALPAEDLAVLLSLAAAGIALGTLVGKSAPEVHTGVQEPKRKNPKNWG